MTEAILFRENFRVATGQALRSGATVILGISLAGIIGLNGIATAASMKETDSDEGLSPAVAARFNPALSHKDSQKQERSFIVTPGVLKESNTLASTDPKGWATTAYHLGVIAPISEGFSAYGQISRLDNDEWTDTSGHVGLRLDF